MDACSASPNDRRGRPLRALRLSLTDICNLRCPYCMPHDAFAPNHRFLAKRELMSLDEIVRLTRIFVALGVRKVRLTGGEPLLRRDLEMIVAQLKRIPGLDELALTTNGIYLAQQATLLRRAGLDRLTVSLDSLDPGEYAILTGGRGHVEDVLAGIEAAHAAGFEALKINAVVQCGINDRSFVELARAFRGTTNVVRFIEYMDVGCENGWQPNDVVPGTEILNAIHEQWPLDAISGQIPGQVAERYRYCDGGGEIGVIMSVTRPFCGDCDRGRVSADGRFFLCLFAENGADLRALLRSGSTDQDIAGAIHSHWSVRSDRYSELRSQMAPNPPLRTSMNILGG